MEKMIFFSETAVKEYCVNQNYFDFLDYAFEKTDYFMLVYVNYYGKGYTKAQKEFKKKLNTYRIKSRSNPMWPGTLNTWSQNTTYKVVYYKNSPESKEILKGVKALNCWSRPSHPEDLAFFKGNQCWFYSVGHESIAAILHATKEDLEFVKEHNFADIMQAKEYNTYYDQYDEELE